MKNQHDPNHPSGTFDQRSESEGQIAGGNATPQASAHRAGGSCVAAHAGLSDDQLYRIARELDIPRRSCLSREALIEAIRQASTRQS